MTYQEQLKTREWAELRDAIIERENNCCQKCNIKKSKLDHTFKSYGFKSYQELRNEGASFTGIDEESASICFIKNSFLNVCDILGDVPSNPEDLFFCLKFDAEGNITNLAFIENEFKNKSLYQLQVHHKHYTKGRLAWQYDHDVFELLCANCHKEVHENETILIYGEDSSVLGTMTTCEKCSGTGHLPEYIRVQGGVCFDCGGRGVYEVEESTR